MKIILKRLEINNFKGIEHMDIEFTKNPYIITGVNETSKTSIFDAYLWTLTDKDSKGQADTKILPVNTIGELVSEEVQTDVTVSLIIDNHTEIAFRRTLCPKLTKKRKSIIKQVTGSTYEYYVNNLDIPVKKSVYTTKIEELFGNKIFNLLSNPTFFASLPWMEQRSILFEIGGSKIPSEADILSLPEFKKLKKRIDGNTFIEGKKNLKASANKVNKQVELIPPAIKENKLNLQVVIKPEETKKVQLESLIKELIVTTETSDENIAEQALKTKKERVKSTIERETLLFKKTLTTIEQDFKQEIWSGEKEIDKIVNKEQAFKTSMSGHQEYIKSLDAQLVSMRENYIAIMEETFKSEQKCYNCGQLLTPEMIEPMREKFNLAKTDRLEKAGERGKNLKEQREKVNEQFEAAKEQKTELTKKLVTLREDLKKDLRVYNDWKANLKDVPIEISKAKEELKKLEQQLKSLKVTPGENKDSEKQRLKETQEKLTAWEKQKIEYENMESIKKRLKVLQQEQKNLTKDYTDIQQDLISLESAISMQVSQVSEVIAEHFELAQFKLFKKHFNGEIEPCCELMYKGARYNKELNTGAKIMIGLDVIKTLTKHYEMTLPVFLDNAEAVSYDLKTDDLQIVKLVVIQTAINEPNLTLTKTGGCNDKRWKD